MKGDRGRAIRSVSVPVNEGLIIDGLESNPYKFILRPTDAQLLMPTSELLQNMHRIQKVSRYSKKYCRKIQFKQKKFEKKVQQAFKVCIDENVKKRCEEDMQQKEKIQQSTTTHTSTIIKRATIAVPPSTFTTTVTPPVVLHVAAASKQFLVNLEFTNSRHMSKFESSVVEKINQWKTQANPPSTSKHSKIVSPRLKNIHTSSIQDETLQDYVSASELKEETSSLTRALFSYVKTVNIACFLYRVLEYEKQAEQHLCEASLMFSIEESKAASIIQAAYQKVLQVRRINSSITVIKDVLTSLKSSCWLYTRWFHLRVRKCQRASRSFIVCTKTRLEALNLIWIRIQSESTKLRGFVSQNVRYYLLLEWLRKLRRSYVNAVKVRSTMCYKGVTTFGEVGIKQVQKFLRLQPHDYTSITTHTDFDFMPQMVTTESESTVVPHFIIYSRVDILDDITYMIQQAKKMTPKDLVNIPKSMSLYVSEQHHHVISKVVEETNAKARIRRDVTTIDAIGVNRKNAASLIRTVNMFLYSRRFSRIRSKNETTRDAVS